MTIELRRLFFHNGHNLVVLFISLLLFNVHMFEAGSTIVTCPVSFCCHPVNYIPTFVNLPPAHRDCHSFPDRTIIFIFSDSHRSPT